MAASRSQRPTREEHEEVENQPADREEQPVDTDDRQRPSRMTADVRRRAGRLPKSFVAHTSLQRLKWKILGFSCGVRPSCAA